jgi:hypothetical protein
VTRCGDNIDAFDKKKQSCTYGTASYRGKTRCARKKKIKQAEIVLEQLEKSDLQEKNKPERGGYNV